jgi:NADPH:quinone reductase-like Zn-dependent oxidoreductase
VPDGAAAVIDPVGSELSEPALRSLRRGGRFVTVGYASGVIPRIPLNLVLVKAACIACVQPGAYRSSWTLPAKPGTWHGVGAHAPSENYRHGNSVAYQRNRASDDIR